jgi:DNA-binding response OmpR family regulator
VRILLVEDDTLIARELALRWRALGWVVRDANSLAAADEQLAADAVELIVLDLGMPDGDGLEWLVRYRRIDRATPVLVLTARDGIAERVKGLRGGADDYLVKPFSVDELDARVDVLTRRGQKSSGQLVHFGRLTWLGQEGRAFVDGRALELSPREFEVLGLLIRCSPRLLSKRALIDALAERNLDVGDAAAEVYVSRLRRRLAGSGTAIRTSRGFGYQLTLERDSTE